MIMSWKLPLKLPVSFSSRPFSLSQSVLLWFYRIRILNPRHVTTWTLGLRAHILTRTVTLDDQKKLLLTEKSLRSKLMQESWFQRVTCLSFLSWCNPTLLNTELNSELWAVYSAQHLPAMKNSAFLSDVDLSQVSTQINICIKLKSKWEQTSKLLYVIRAVCRHLNAFCHSNIKECTNTLRTCSECTVCSHSINMPQSLPAAPCKNRISCSNGCFSERLRFTAQWLNNKPYNTAIHAFGLMIIK